MHQFMDHPLSEPGKTYKITPIIIITVKSCAISLVTETR